MTPKELAVQARKTPYVVLRMEGPCNGYTRRLFGKYGPRGEVLCGRDTHQVVRFKSNAVLRAIAKYFPEDDPED